MNKILKGLGLAVLLIGLVRLLSFYTTDKTHPTDPSYLDQFNEDYAIYALPLPEDLNFMGEAVPFKDPEIFERYDREILVNTYWQSQTVLFIKRSARWFPVIEPILKKHGIPTDFKYLPLIESGFMNVVSPAGAVGFWQIMESTGKGYGLEINKEVDERYHVVKATEAACIYLKEAYKELGSWTLAAASYNMGVTGVKKQLERQRAKSYYDLTLNEETGRYVFRIMAVKEILENQEKYGFKIREKDKYKPIPTLTVSVDTPVTQFGDFAQQLGVNYRILKYHNPWLRYEYLPNKTGKTYQIKIPKEGFYALVDESALNPTDTILEKTPPAISDTTNIEEEDVNEG